MSEQSLPSNIDSEVLALTKALTGIAEAYKLLANNLVASNEKIKELEESKESEEN